jgi:hypothetical protein
MYICSAAETDQISIQSDDLKVNAVCLSNILVQVSDYFSLVYLVN